METFDANFVDVPETTHRCESKREGDWIVFTCKQCPDYERRYNYKTGVMKVRSGSEDINHIGHFVPEYLQKISQN